MFWSFLHLVLYCMKLLTMTVFLKQLRVQNSSGYFIFLLEKIGYEWHFPCNIHSHAIIEFFFYVGKAFYYVLNNRSKCKSEDKSTCNKDKT